MPGTDDMLTQKEAAAILRKSVKAIYRLRKAGELRSLPGRPVLIRRADLDDYIERTAQWGTAGCGSNGTTRATGKSIGPKDGVRADKAFARAMVRRLQLGKIK